MKSTSRALEIYRSLGWGKFALVTTGFTVLIQFVFAVLLILSLQLLVGGDADLRGGENPVDEVEQFNPIKYLLLSVLMAPFFETLIFQSFLIKSMQRFISSSWLLVSISTILFGAFHLRTSLLSGLQALISGSFFAYAFIVWMDKTKKFWVAVRVTCICHMLHNTVYLGLHYVPASLIFGFL